MFQFIKTLAANVTNASAGKVKTFVNDTGNLATKDDVGTVTVYGAGGANTFGTIAVAGQTSVAADSTTDTLTLVAGTNVTITTNATTDTITINSTATGGASARTYGAIESAGRTLTATDINQTILYSSATAGTFTIPTDAVLGITGNSEAVFRVVQLGTGAVSIVGNGTSVNNKPTDIPPAIQFGTEVATRYGVQTYIGTRV